MGAHHCHHDTTFNGRSSAYRRILWWVIAINATMFLVEVSAGFAASSEALKADALDFLGDSLTYGMSLAVLGLSLRWRARAALVKGISLALMAVLVLGSTFYHVLVAQSPQPQIMGVVGFLALAANLASVLLLMRYRNGDANVRAVWLCSRNDAIGNVAVIVAASGVWASATAWPDLIVALGMAGLFLMSSVAIIRQAMRELRCPPAPAPHEFDHRAGVAAE